MFHENFKRSSLFREFLERVTFRVFMKIKSCNSMAIACENTRNISTRPFSIVWINFSNALKLHVENQEYRRLKGRQRRWQLINQSDEWIIMWKRVEGSFVNFFCHSPEPWLETSIGIKFKRSMWLWDGKVVGTKLAKPGYSKILLVKPRKTFQWFRKESLQIVIRLETMVPFSVVVLCFQNSKANEKRRGNQLMTSKKRTRI